MAAHAQPPHLEATLDTNEMLIGQQTTLRLTGTFHAADTVVMPTYKDTITANVEIVDKPGLDTAFEGNNLEQKIIRSEYVVTSFDSGYYVIKPFVALVNGDSVLSNPLLLTVHTVPVDTAQGFADIKEPAEIPFNVKGWLATYWPWLLGGLAALTIIVLLYLYYRNKPKPDVPIVKTEPSLPPHEEALQALEKLEQQKLWQK